MSFDFSQTWSHHGVSSQHGIDEIFEVGTEKVFFGFTFAVHFPKSLIFFLVVEQLEVGIFVWIGLGKWGGACDHDEKNDSGSEKVDGLAIVVFVDENFGGHVGLCS